MGFNIMAFTIGFLTAFVFGEASYNRCHLFVFLPIHIFIFESQSYDLITGRERCVLQNAYLEGGFPFSSQLLLTVIISGFFLGLGYLIGLNLDNANPNKSKEKELIYLKENSIYKQYYKV